MGGKRPTAVDREVVSFYEADSLLVELDVYRLAPWATTWRLRCLITYAGLPVPR
ncbi:MAG: hypothetical protein J7L75_00115 [Thermoproteales archaeon]|nr:hypothetical protein [Thermoproteales archaeon]